MKMPKCHECTTEMCYHIGYDMVGCPRCLKWYDYEWKHKRYVKDFTAQDIAELNVSSMGKYGAEHAKRLQRLRDDDLDGLGSLFG